MWVVVVMLELVSWLRKRCEGGTYILILRFDVGITVPATGPLAVLGSHHSEVL